MAYYIRMKDGSCFAGYGRRRKDGSIQPKSVDAPWLAYRTPSYEEITSVYNGLIRGNPEEKDAADIFIY